MKTRLVPLLALIPVCTFAQPSGPLTNDSIAVMLESGVRMPEIVRVVCSAQTTSFNLTPAGADQILKAGIPEEVYKMMAARQVGLPCQVNRTQPRGGVRFINASYSPSGSSGGVASVASSRTALVVPRGQPVKLRLSRNVSSAQLHTDDQIQFEVLEDVVYNHTLVIERGAPAWGTVTEALPKRTMGRAGKIEVHVDAVQLANGGNLALKYATVGQRNPHIGLMVGLMVPTALVDLPATPLWLLMHGKDSVIKDGTDFVAFTDSTANLDAQDFEMR